MVLDSEFSGNDMLESSFRFSLLLPNDPVDACVFSSVYTVVPAKQHCCEILAIPLRTKIRKTQVSEMLSTHLFEDSKTT